MPDPEQENRTEDPTARRKRKARKEGNVAQSQEVKNALFLLVAILMFKTFGGFMMGKMQVYTMDSLLNIAEGIKPNDMPNLLHLYLGKFFTVFAPFGVAMLIVAFSASILQYGWLWTTKNIKFQWKEAFKFKNPFASLMKPEGIKNFAKSFLKVIILGFITYMVLKGRIQEILNLIDMDINQVFAYVSDLIIDLITYILIFYVAFAAIDFAITKVLHNKKLKMTKFEVKDERKQMEGDPQVRNKIRSLMFEAARKRMMEDAPKADVVITNPTHIAVALKYDANKFDAPYVIAKGKRKIAEKIKQIARENNIPIIEDKPLARMLYKTVEVGQEIIPELYSTVAEIIAQVYKMKNRKI